jgi:GDP-4-dehydro-6-deoxy-D-mannose reductase
MQKPARILITGAGGFVGRRLAAALAAKYPDAEITGLDRADKTSERFDITDGPSVEAAIALHRPTHLVHLAAISSVPQSFLQPELTWRTNVFGTLSLITALQAHAPDCRMLFVSSAEIYGRSTFDGQPVKESALLQPNNPYAASKAAADIMVREACNRGLKASIVRPFNHTGPGQSDAFVVPAFCSQIARIEKGLQPPVIEVGELNGERDFCDVRDIIDLYILIIGAGENLPLGLTLNAASGIPRRIGDILDILLSKARLPITIRQDPSRLRAVGVPRILGDAGLARQVLGWTAKVPFERTLQDTLDYWRSL